MWYGTLFMVGMLLGFGLRALLSVQKLRDALAEAVFHQSQAELYFNKWRNGLSSIRLATDEINDLQAELAKLRGTQQRAGNDDEVALILADVLTDAPQAPAAPGVVTDAMDTRHVGMEATG